MGEIMGSYHEFACNRLDELFLAIEANTGQLRSYVAKNKKRGIAVFVDGVVVTMEEMKNAFINVKNKEVKIVPLLVGAGFYTGFATLLAVKGGLSVGVAKFVSFIASAVLLTAVSVGLTLLMQSLFKPDKPESATSASYAFGTAENVTKQGNPVPVGYGRFKVGSVVLSSCIKNIERSIARGSTFNATLRSALTRQIELLNTRSEIQADNVQQNTF